MTDPQPPHNLDYRSPGESPEPERARKSFRLDTRGAGKFFLGLLIGSAASAAVWILGWNLIDKPGSGLTALTLPTLKAVIIGALLFVPRWRPLAGRLLLSMIIGAFIFFGSCAAHFK